MKNLILLMLMIWIAGDVFACGDIKSDIDDEVKNAEARLTTLREEYNQCMADRVEETEVEIQEPEESRDERV